LSEIVEAEPRPVSALMALAQAGDREAYAELQKIGEAQGISYTESWTSHLIRYRLQDRASSTNLLARASIEEELAAVIRDLSDPRDGAIERLIIARAAICALDADLSELEHLRAIEHYDDARDAEVYDRRRDRAHRRLLATLKALADVRRINRPVVQVNVGDGNTNVLNA
jgi:hypothetical protein